ncbi:hypothetical protein P3342_007546 [Pyrenophora teres f. teres]|nr:hypothetical protein P3342_007546 [Pyrenophora teres f. teres]
MAMDLMSQWILSTTVIATGSSLSSFLPIQPTRSNRSMWCCLSHFLKPTPMSSPTISIRRKALLIKKGDFFPLFWSAWISSFTESLILKAFEATGIWPMDANVILRRFASTPDAERSSSSGLSDHDWRKLDRLLENEVLKEALQHKKKHKKKGKALDLQQRQEYHGGAVHWSSRKLREARAREAVRERDEAEEKLQKAQAKKQREEAQLQRQVELEQRRVERQRLKEMREQERAEKAAERARKVEAQHQTKTIQQAQQRKCKAPRVAPPSNKRQKRAGAAQAGVQTGDEPSAAPAKVTSRGRKVKLPEKYR